MISATSEEEREKTREEREREEIRGREREEMRRGRRENEENVVGGRDKVGKRRLIA